MYLKTKYFDYFASLIEPILIYGINYLTVYFPNHFRKNKKKIQWIFQSSKTENCEDDSKNKKYQSLKKKNF